MKTTKLKLQDLNVKSFITNLNEAKKGTIAGGNVVQAKSDDTCTTAMCNTNATECKFHTCNGNGCGVW